MLAETNCPKGKTGKGIKGGADGKTIFVGYYNYHAVAKRLIREGRLVRFEYVDDWNGIRPALVLFFDNHAPMPIRKERWIEYECLIGNV